MERRKILLVLILLLGVIIVSIVLARILLEKPREHAFNDLYSSELSSGQVAFTYLGYSGVILRTENLVIGIDVDGLLDEEEIRSLGKMDLLIYTHIHSDHFNEAIARKIHENTGCFIVAEHSVYEALSDEIPSGRLLELREGVLRVELQGEEVVFHSVYGVHPAQIVLFLLETDGLKIFHGGDSGYSQSIKSLGHADIAFLPTGNPSPSASPEDAVKMALDLSPKIITLFHGSPGQHASFIDQAESKITAEIIPTEKGKTYLVEAQSQ
ncbi:MAG: MBL fold metallo-hydrolase [Thermoproteota archaeon]